MYETDGTAFNTVLDRLSAVFSKEVTDPMREAYWGALRDLPLPLIEERARAHARFGKFFPKPFELRPKEDRPKDKDPAEEAKFKGYQQQSAEHLDELHGQDPKRWYEIVSPKVYELGRARGMPETQIEHKLRSYVPHSTAKERLRA